MTTQSDWNSLVDQLGDASQQARDTLAEVRSELKEARRVIRELKQERDVEVKKAVDEQIEAAVKRGLEEYQGTVKKAMDNAVRHVQTEFEKLFNTYMTGRPSGHGHDGDLRDLVERKQRG